MFPIIDIINQILQKLQPRESTSFGSRASHSRVLLETNTAI